MTAGGPQLTDREKERKKKRVREGEEEDPKDEQCRIRKQSRVLLGLRFGDVFML